MKKRKIFKLFISLLILVPCGAMAKECTYKSDDGKYSASFDPGDKYVYVSKYRNDRAKKDAKTNKGKHEPDKCYKYLVLNAGGGKNARWYSFALSDNTKELLSLGGNMLTLNGSDVSNDKKCTNAYNGSGTHYNTKQENLNLDIKKSYYVYFNFLTDASGNRTFCVSYDGNDSCSEKFSGTNINSVTTSIKNKNGSSATFSIQKEYLDSFFDGCVANSNFNVKENGNGYMLVSDLKTDNINNKTNTDDGTYDEGEKVYGCEVVPEEVRKWISISLNFVKYAALILVIVLGTIDFIKAAASGEPDSMKKAGQSFIKRVVAVVILFLLPMLVELILNLINLYGTKNDCFGALK